MKKINLLGVALALAACAPVARAQDVNTASAKIWANFYVILANTVRGGKAENKSSDKMFVLNVPGVFIPPTWSEPSEEDRWTSWMLLDQALSPQPTHEVTGSAMPTMADLANLGNKPLSATWDRITDKGVPEPGPLLTAAQQQKLKSLRALCDEKTSPRMMAYIENRNAYLEAETVKEEAIFESYKDKKGGRIAPLIARKATDAETAWTNKGYRGEMEVAIQELHELSTLDPKVHWVNMRQDFKAANIPSVKTARIVTIPQMETWGGDAGWIKFTFKMSETANSTTSNKSDFSASAKVKVGFFKAGGGASGASRAMTALTNDKGTTISLEFKKVLILRPWLDWDVFRSDKWSLPGPIISDGKGGGALPMVTNAFIVVRNVKFTSKAIETYKTELEKEFHSNANASYGPFSVNSTYNQEDRKDTDGSKEEKGSITIKEPQIIGYFCTLVPKSPLKTAK